MKCVAGPFWNTQKSTYCTGSANMRIPLYVLGFGLVLSLGAAGQNQQPATPVNPTTPANHVGDGAQSKSGTPVAPSTSSPAPTGGVAGAASSSAAQTPDAQNPNNGVNVMADSDLQGQIQNALTKEPTLAGDSPHVTVSRDSIELAGSVKTNKEKITASRIVQSYAGSKKLVNNLTINGQSQQPVSAEPDKNGAASKPPQK